MRLWATLPAPCTLKQTLVLHMLVLYTLTFVLVLPLLCGNMKHSMYFSQWQNSDDAKDFTRKENDIRLENALDFFKHSEPDLMPESSKIMHRSAPLIALTLVTASRNRHMVDNYRPMYLTQVVHKFLTLLSEIKEVTNYNIRFSVCNVDFDPDSYHEVHELTKFVKVFSRYSGMNMNILHPFEKEKQDYVYCLNSSLSGGADYVMLVEDDALPRTDFFPVLFHILDSHLTFSKHSERNIPHSVENQPPDFTAFVKFYHPERLSTFSLYNPIPMVELVSLTLLLGSILSSIYITLFRPLVSTRTVMLCMCLYTVFVCMAVGRPHIMEARRVMSPYLYSYAPAPSCCTPAMLYPRPAATAIVRYMSSVTCGNNFGKDSVLDEFRRDTGSSAHLVQPNTVQHIGMYSVLHNNIVDPFLM